MASSETSALQYIYAPTISPNLGSSIPQTHEPPSSTFVEVETPEIPPINLASF